MWSNLPLARPLPPLSQPRILAFDIETVAAGFADPAWVPQKIICVSWSWVGSDKIETRACCGPKEAMGVGLYGPQAKEKRWHMLNPLLAAIEQADVVTGHYIKGFDLSVINAEAMRLGLTPIYECSYIDTIDLVRSKGFKKGLDNLGVLLGCRTKKQAMDWQEWDDAYDVSGIPEVITRCESDVQLQKEIREKLLERGWIGSRPKVWKGRK